MAKTLILTENELLNFIDEQHKRILCTLEEEERKKPKLEYNKELEEG